MKASTREGVDVASKKPEKERITDEEEDMFWQKGLSEVPRRKPC